MKKLWIVFFATVFALMLNSAAFSNELIVFPAKGQSDEQVEQDKFSCYQWAKKQTGFDPMAPPTTKTAPPQAQAQRGGAVSGAAKGALLGVTTGAIMNNDKGRSASAGAAAGGLIGGMRRQEQVQQQKQQQQQWAQNEANRYAQQRSNYNRAYSACLEGKGYTVK